MANAYDVAQAIITDLGGRADKAKLQKLLYYVQGWHLAWNDDPLFEEDLQAWAMGPVVYPVWSRYASALHGVPGGDADNLSAAERTHVNMVVDVYGSLSGAELARMTHHEDPWKDARGELPAGRSSNRVMSKESIREWFSTVSFSPEAEEDAIDDDLVTAVIEGTPGAFEDLVEDATGVRPRTG